MQNTSQTFRRLYQFARRVMINIHVHVSLTERKWQMQSCWEKKILQVDYKCRKFVQNNFAFIENKKLRWNVEIFYHNIKKLMYRDENINIF
jgi:hypothetical protein